MEVNFIPVVRTCGIRRTPPEGPWGVCRDQDCFPECYSLAYNRKYGEDPTPEILQEVIMC